MWREFMSGGFAFARKVFLLAGIYGLVMLLPQYFMEDALNRRFPPALTHPEDFYGFIGVAVAWQCAFLVIARDVSRFRFFMLPAILEKLSFGIATLALYARGRVVDAVLYAGTMDLLFAIMFFLAFLSCRPVEHSGRSSDYSNDISN
jgi:hypothetical protein